MRGNKDYLPTPPSWLKVLYNLAPPIILHWFFSVFHYFVFPSLEEHFLQESIPSPREFHGVVWTSESPYLWYSSGQTWGWSGGRDLTGQISKSAQTIAPRSPRVLGKWLYKIITACSPSPSPQLSCSDPKKIYSYPTRSFQNLLQICPLKQLHHLDPTLLAAGTSPGLLRRGQLTPQLVSKCWGIKLARLRDASALPFL